MRVPSLLIALSLCACAAEEGPPKAEESSLLGVFFGAMFDEMRGPPSSAELAQKVQFSHGGVHFERPRVLRLSVDRDGMDNWALERGDFSLNLYVADHEYSAADFLDTTVEVLASDDDPLEGPLPGRKVNWCGQEVTGVLYRFHFIGEPRVYEGFELPPTRNGARFLIFDDIRRNDRDWSETALATFAAVDASIRCDGGKIPRADSAD
jgi:hypothetical protein